MRRSTQGLVLGKRNGVRRAQDAVFRIITMKGAAGARGVNSQRSVMILVLSKNPTRETRNKSDQKLSNEEPPRLYVSVPTRTRENYWINIGVRQVEVTFLSMRHNREWSIV